MIKKVKSAVSFIFGNSINMRIRKKPWALPELKKCKFFIDNPYDYRGKWIDLFEKEQPIHLELGTGKGTFISEIASKNPQINYIAVDIKNDMLGYARRKIVRSYSGINREINNVILVACNVERIDLMMSDMDRIDRIYINFCNPWPKHKHKKRRLTYPTQLKNYRKFLIDFGEIYFKTDDDNLFNESISYFMDNGFEIVFKTYDLHSKEIKDNIITEHEQMFIDMGSTIKFLVAKKCKVEGE